MKKKCHGSISLNRFVITILLLCVAAILHGCTTTSEPGNNAPIVINMTPTKKLVDFNETITIHADVNDADDDSLSFIWISSKGNFISTTLDSAVWSAPDTSGSISIILQVSDKFSGKDQDSTIITVKNRNPVIQSLTATKNNVMVGNIITVKVQAQDPDGDDLTYAWTATSGDFVSETTMDSIRWRASTLVEDATIKVKVSDTFGDYAEQEILLKVFQETGSVWIADTYNNDIVKIATNGAQLYRVGGLSTPSDIAVDLNDRSVWVSDYGNSRVMKYSNDGEILATITGLDRPTNVAVQSNGNVWVSTMADSSQLIEISYSGTILRKINGFKEPKSLDINYLSGDIWIADTGNNRIIMLNAEAPDNYSLGSTVGGFSYDTQFGGYAHPEGIAVDQSLGHCWVTDTGNGRIVRISASDQTEFIIGGFLNPRGIDINIKEGSCWVANTGDNEVVKIFSDVFQLPVKQPWAYNIDQDAGFHLEIKGYTLPWAVSVNSNEKIVWFSDDYRVIKVEDKGASFSVLAELVNFNSPRALFVNPGIKP